MNANGHKRHQMRSARELTGKNGNVHSSGEDRALYPLISGFFEYLEERKGEKEEASGELIGRLEGA